MSAGSKAALILGMVLMVARPLYAFELLSEGAMDTVSAVSAGSAEDILNIAGPTAAGLRVDDDYEQLPFESSVRVGVLDLDETSEDLDFAFSKEVEGWVENLRRQGEIDFEVSVVDELLPSSFEDTGLFIPEPQEDQVLFFDGDEEGDLIFEIGRIEQTITVQQSGVESITYSVSRYVESASTTDSRTFLDRTIGNGYISDLRSNSNVSIARIRD